MIRKCFFLTVVAAVIVFSPLCLRAETEVTARSYLLVEKETMAVLAGKNYHEELPPASTTKVMTTILALETLDGSAPITATASVRKIPPSKLNLAPGKSYKAADLIRGTMVESANDAAYTLGQAIAGSEEKFAVMMNEKAREIGAMNTHFRNASGLYLPGHYTTCWDLALMFRYALSNDQFWEIVSQKYFLFKGERQDIRYANHNRLLFCFEPSIGGKTGFTRASKHCYVGAFEKDGHIYILALLGSRNLWGDAVNLLARLYDKVPTKTELTLAKACPLTLSSFKVPVEHPPVVKKSVKKAKRSKGRTAKSSR